MTQRDITTSLKKQCVCVGGGLHASQHQLLHVPSYKLSSSENPYGYKAHSSIVILKLERE
jgi:hypothetical protein